MFDCRRDAGRLFAATVWLLVVYLFGCIPLVGGAIESVIPFILFFVLSGWGRIRIPFGATRRVVDPTRR